MGALTRVLYILLVLLCVPAWAAAQGDPVIIIDPVTSDAARVIAGVLQTSGGGGGGGTVDQGANNGSMLTSAAWSMRLIFGDAVIDPRLVSVQNWLTTAIAPSSTRLSDGAAFYDARVIRSLTFGTDAVDVSGSAVTAVVTATNLDIRDLTFAQDKVDVSGSAVSTTPPAATTASGTIDATDETVEIATPNGGTVGVQLDGTIPDGDALAFERQVVAAGPWSPIPARYCLASECGPSLSVPNEVTSDIWRWQDGIDELPKAFTINAAGSVAIRVRHIDATGAVDVDLLLQPAIIPDMVNVRGSVAASVSGTVNIGNTPTVNVGTIAATAIDIRPLSQVTDSVTVGNNVSTTITNTNVATLPGEATYLAIAGQESVAAPTAGVWYIRKQWALPGGAVFTADHAWASITTALTKTLIGVIRNLGNLNLSTNTFTAGTSVASPFHYARLFGCVTTVMSATADTITPTYTDDLGNSQATAGVAFASASPVGNCYEFPLAAAAGITLDSGVRAVTAATDSAAPTGVVTFYGVNPLADFAGTAANQTETQTLPQSPRLSTNEQIVILMQQAATMAQLKTWGIAGSIR